MKLTTKSRGKYPPSPPPLQIPQFTLVRPTDTTVVGPHSQNISIYHDITPSHPPPTTTTPTPPPLTTTHAGEEGGGAQLVLFKRPCQGNTYQPFNITRLAAKLDLFRNLYVSLSPCCSRYQKYFLSILMGTLCIILYCLHIFIHFWQICFNYIRM